MEPGSRLVARRCCVLIGPDAFVGSKNVLKKTTSLFVDDMAMTPYELTDAVEARVCAGDIPGVVALMEADVYYYTVADESDRRYGLRPVWRAWKCNLISGVVRCSSLVPPALFDDVFRALLGYRSPNGDMFGFVRGSRPCVHLLSWAGKILDLQKWDLLAMQRVAEAWTGETARWGLGRASWVAAVVC